MLRLSANTLVLSLFLTIAASSAHSQGCNFVTSASAMTLTADCTTTSTITIPDGVTLNGQNYTITAVNPPGTSFLGPVLTNATGATRAFIKNVILDAPNLGPQQGCENPVSGIVFDSVSGSITGTTVLHMVNATADGNTICILNFGIYITNAATGAPVNVTLSASKVLFAGTQAALFANGNGVVVNVSGSQFQSGVPPTFPNLLAVWLKGVGGSFSGNIVEASPGGGGGGIFLQATAAGLKITSNNINLIGGHTNDGILIGADNAVVSGNRVFNYGLNGSVVGSGINNGGFTSPASNKITKNEVRCYATPFVNVTVSTYSGNKALPCPWP